MDQGFFCRIRGVDGVPQNCEVAARSPPLAAGRTDARNGPACVGFIDRSEREPPRPPDATALCSTSTASYSQATGSEWTSTGNTPYAKRGAFRWSKYGPKLLAVSFLKHFLVK